MDNIDWDKFEFNISGAKPFKVKLKKIEYFEVKLDNITGKAKITYLVEPKQ